MRVMKVIAVAVLVLMVTGTLVATIGCGTKYSLTISVTGEGTTNPTVGTITYSSGQSVTITASPASGWQFDSWSGDASETSATAIVTMNADKAVVANFIKQYSLTLNVNGQGVTNPTAGIRSYGSGESVTITASPASGWQFDSWSGSVSGTSASTIVTMDSDKSITANFTLTPITIVDSSISIVSGATYSIDLATGYYNVSFTSDDAVTLQWLGGNVNQENNSSGAVYSYTKNNIQAYGSTTLKIYNPTGIFNNPTALLHLTIIKVQ